MCRRRAVLKHPNILYNTLYGTLTRVWTLARQGTALYLRVLEALLRAEEARTGRAAFPALLGSASFHTCLLALAFELVAASYCMARPARAARLRDALSAGRLRCVRTLSLGGSACARLGGVAPRRRA